MARNVVTVEDEREIATLLGLVLRHPDIEVHAAHDGKTGLELIRQLKPDLVLLDVMMPEMGGWEVYEAIRADEALQKTPIVFVSVRSVPLERKQAFAQSQIDCYMTKPFDTVKLRREIGRMLGTPELWPAAPARPPQASATGEFEATEPTPPNATQEAARVDPHAKNHEPAASEQPAAPAIERPVDDRPSS
jgi:CheY-like chemotaxis protein